MKIIYKMPFFIFSVFLFLPVLTQAASVFDISYPIADLGNCATQAECKSYCDVPQNADTCALWAENIGIIPKRQISVKPVSTPPSDGNIEGERPAPNREQELRDEEAFVNAPGGCKTPRECDAYCRVEENLGECMDYSVKYGYMTKEEADKVLEKSKKGGPGGCKGEKECNEYCRGPKNAKECMQFVVDEGKITQEEADFMIKSMEEGEQGPGKPRGKGPNEPKVKQEKITEILKDKTGPGGCKNPEECSNYCMGGEHMDECMKFAEENQLMEPAEMEKAKKMNAMGGPGGCKGQKECDDFCGKEENRDACFNFAKDNGMLSDDEVVRIEKQMQIVKKLDKQAGPGGCKSQEECKTYCGTPENLEECINFSGKQGMLSGDAVKSMMGQTQEAKMKMQQLGEYQNFRKLEGQEGMMPPQDIQDGQQWDQDGQQRGPGPEGSGGGPMNFFKNFFGGDKQGGDMNAPQGEFNNIQKEMGQPGNMPPGGQFPGGQQQGDRQFPGRVIDQQGTEGRTMQPQGGTRIYAPGTSGGQGQMAPGENQIRVERQYMGTEGQPGQQMQFKPPQGINMPQEFIPREGATPGERYVMPILRNEMPPTGGGEGGGMMGPPPTSGGGSNNYMPQQGMVPPQQYQQQGGVPSQMPYPVQNQGTTATPPPPTSESGGGSPGTQFTPPQGSQQMPTIQQPINPPVPPSPTSPSSMNPISSMLGSIFHSLLNILKASE